MCNAVFFTDYLVDINNSNYYYCDSLWCCFPHHSWVFLYLQNILIAHSCLFSTHRGCFKFFCHMPRGCGKPKTVVCAVHWQSRNPDLCRGGTGDAAAAKHRACPYPASVDVCIWLMLRYQGTSLRPLGEYLWSQGCSDFWVRDTRTDKYTIAWLAGCSRGNLRPKGWLLTTEGSFRGNPAGQKVVGK